MEVFERITHVLNKILIWGAGSFLGAMILLTCANIFLRLVWVPVRGAFELMGFFGAIVTSFALGYTQIKRGHIAPPYGDNLPINQPIGAESAPQRHTPPRA